MNHIPLLKLLDYLKSQSIGFEYRGNTNIAIAGFSSVERYKPDTLTWVKDNKRLVNTKLDLPVLLAVVQSGTDMDFPNIIISNESKRAFFSIIDHFFSEESAKPAIGTGTYISDNVKLGSNIQIGNNCVIDGDIVIGDNTVVEHNVVIANKVTIGRSCYIQSCSCIGHDGYGYSEDENHNKTMIRHYGGVEIGNNVFIGAHVNIARGTIDDTVISSGVKIAPSTHIGHNNHIDENASIVCSNLYGSVTIGRNAYVSACTIRNQIKIGDSSIVGMGAIVTKDVEPGITVIGNPAKPFIKS